MSEKLTVALIGCGRLGQHYAAVYDALPDTELVAIAEYNPERRKTVGERFGITALFQDAEELFAQVVPIVFLVVCSAFKVVEVQAGDAIGLSAVHVAIGDHEVAEKRQHSAEHAAIKPILELVTVERGGGATHGSASCLPGVSPKPRAKANP